VNTQQNNNINLPEIYKQAEDK